MGKKQSTMTHFAPLISVFAFVSNSLLHRFSSFSGTEMALLTVCKADAAREATAGCSAASQCMELNMELKGNFMI